MDWASFLNSPVGVSASTGFFVLAASLIPTVLHLRDRKKERELRWGARLYEKRLAAFGHTAGPILIIRDLGPFISGGGGEPDERSRFQKSLIDLNWARHSQRAYLPKRFSKLLDDFTDAAARIWASTAESELRPQTGEKIERAEETIRQNSQPLLNEIGQAVGPWVDWFESQMVRTVKHPQKE
jgi:hypothetical protein